LSPSAELLVSDLMCTVRSIYAAGCRSIFIVQIYTAVEGSGEIYWPAVRTTLPRQKITSKTFIFISVKEVMFSSTLVNYFV